MSLLKGKNVLIVGVANKHSIASGIATSMAGHGANLAFTYQNERLRQKVERLAKDWGSEICLPCDVGIDKEIEEVFTQLNKKWDGLDCIVHAVGFAPSSELDGNFVDVTTRETAILLMLQPGRDLKLLMTLVHIASWHLLKREKNL